jgi:hypothetical protein
MTESKNGKSKKAQGILDDCLVLRFLENIFDFLFFFKLFIITCGRAAFSKV